MKAINTSAVGTIEAQFRTKRAEGKKLLVPFITAGQRKDWLDDVFACEAAGADAIEIGIPFSDPMMDGVVIQEATFEALSRGVTPLSVMAEVRNCGIGIPLVAMTAYNIAFRMGEKRFASVLAESGFSGTILPDLQLDEAASWLEIAEATGIENINLVAPITSEERMRRICEASRGWVYGVGSLGVTGERSALAESALRVAQRLKLATDKPILVGIGVSNAEQAQEVANASDGVIVGSALVRRILQGCGAQGVHDFVAELRAGVDAASSSTLS